jgi:hypothetical protein
MTYAQDREKELIQEFSDKYKDHIPKFSTDSANNTSILEWRHKSGSSRYGFTAILHKGYLMLYGSFGEAVFCWRDPITWEFFNDMELDYFCGKCRASRVGSRFTEWSLESVCKAISGLETSLSTETVQKMFNGFGGAAMSVSQKSWVKWLYDHCAFLEGTDLFAHLGNCGEVISIDCIAFFVGLKMAAQQWLTQNHGV